MSSLRSGDSDNERSGSDSLDFGSKTFAGNFRSGRSNNNATNSFDPFAFDFLRPMDMPECIEDPPATRNLTLPHQTPGQSRSAGSRIPFGSGGTDRIRNQQQTDLTQQWDGSNSRPPAPSTTYSMRLNRPRGTTLHSDFSDSFQLSNRRSPTIDDGSLGFLATLDHSTLVEYCPLYSRLYQRLASNQHDVEAAGTRLSKSQEELAVAKGNIQSLQAMLEKMIAMRGSTDDRAPQISDTSQLEANGLVEKPSWQYPVMESYTPEELKNMFWCKSHWLDKTNRPGDKLPPPGPKGRQRRSQGINVPFRFITDENGTIIDGHRVQLISNLVWGFLFSLLDTGGATLTWERLGLLKKRALYVTMKNAYKEIAYCENDWKADWVAKEIYESFGPKYVKPYIEARQAVQKNENLEGLYKIDDSVGSPLGLGPESASSVTKVPSSAAGSRTVTESQGATQVSRDKRKSTSDQSAPKPKPKKRRLNLKNPYDAEGDAAPAAVDSQHEDGSGTQCDNVDTWRADDGETECADDGNTQRDNVNTQYDKGNTQRDTHGRDVEQDNREEQCEAGEETQCNGGLHRVDDGEALHVGDGRALHVDDSGEQQGVDDVTQHNAQHESDNGGQCVDGGEGQGTDGGEGQGTDGSKVVEVESQGNPPNGAGGSKPRRTRGKLVEMPKEVKTGKQYFQQEQFQMGNVTHSQFTVLWKNMSKDEQNEYQDKADNDGRKAAEAAGRTWKPRARRFGNV
ncbi:hypothetical protein NEOLEDRAFT_1184736 [Neolentinus lepideus HHB14362 ss-1]|uniref:Uncharacterized protein n=1 Tax=Neolentinus lepideus HHB14362 ss-1 TaxID=1314782 RepID=A0A165M6W3_9AGAM|nr:hypothetical protein NEOLEDRAFT_1184736 [Neolentinus lepideus HHB14362 ss-1]